MDPRHDLYALGEIFIANEYQPCLTVKEPRLIWDIGGNIGFFTLWTATHFPKATFHYFEPAPETFQRLKRNRSDNPTVDWHVHPFGLGAVDEICTAYVPTNSGETSRYGSKGKPVEFHLKNISAYWEEMGRPEIQIPKIDCEGGECDIISGASADFLKSVHFLIMEIHDIPNHQPERLREKLLRVGFSVTWTHNIPGVITAIRL